jgi:tetratricopeptide (TPR) repeat protein
MADVILFAAAADAGQVDALAQALSVHDVALNGAPSARMGLLVWSAAALSEPTVLTAAQGHVSAGAQLVTITLDRSPPPAFARAWPVLAFAGWTQDANAAQINAVAAALKAAPASAISDQVEAGWSEEIATKQGFRAAIRFHRIGLGSSRLPARDRTWRYGLIGALVMLMMAGSVGAVLFWLSRPPASGEASAPGGERVRSLTQAAFAAVPGGLGEGVLARARAVFENAAAQLVQDPDPEIRALLTKAGDQRAALWARARARRGEPLEGPLAGAAGALLLAHKEPGALAALTQANAANPQDGPTWALLADALAQDGQAKEARAASLAAEGLAALAKGDRGAGESAFQAALALTRRPLAQGFLLGQLGDAAAQVDDFRTAAAHYRAALAQHKAAGALGAWSLDASKLARAELALGRAREACAVLRAARAAGAETTPGEKSAACSHAGP